MNMKSHSLATILAIKLLFCGLIVLCVYLGITTYHFYSRYQRETAVAKNERYYLQGRIDSLSKDNEKLQSQEINLTQTLEQTVNAVASAAQPSVSTQVPTEKPLSP